MQDLISLKMIASVAIIYVEKMASDYHWMLIYNDESSDAKFFIALLATSAGICGIVMGLALIIQNMADPSKGSLDGFALAVYVAWRFREAAEQETKHRIS